MSSEWPGVGIASICSPSISNDESTTGRSSSSSCSTWSAWACVRSTASGRSPCCATNCSSGVERRSGVDENRRSAALVADDVGVREPLGMHALADQHGARLPRQSCSGRAHARPHESHDDDRQGEVEQASRPRRGSGRDARLLVRGAAPAAPERQARHRRPDDREEAARAAVHVDAEAVGQARRPGTRRAEGRPRGSRARGAHPQGGARRAARRADGAGPAARGAAAEADRGPEDAAGEGRVLPHAEGSDQGAVLGRRGAGADRRGGDRHRRGDGRRRTRDPARRRTRPSRCRRAQRRSRSSRRPGALEDFTSSGDDIDRELAAISAGTAVDDDLARLKAELDPGSTPAPLEAGEEKKELET